MREFQERRRFKRLLHSRYAIAVLVILCILLGRAVWDVYGKYERSKEIRDRTKAELAALDTRQKLLNQGIADLNTDLGKEKEVRDRFGVVKEGERMIILVNGASGSANVSPAPEKSWWDRLVSFFTRD